MITGGQLGVHPRCDRPDQQPFHESRPNFVAYATKFGPVSTQVELVRQLLYRWNSSTERIL